MSYESSPKDCRPKLDQMHHASSGQIDAAKLQRVLSNGTKRPFNPETCRLLITLFDLNRNGVIDPFEFKPLWDYVNEWLRDFEKFAENEISLAFVQLEAALSKYGYRFSGTFYAILMSKYDRTRTAKSLTFAIFLFHQSEMSNLKRFEISDSASKRRAEEFPTHAKQLHEVVEFNSPGQFYVHARIADLQYSLYKACPLRAKGGLPCKRKLDNELFCVSCAHRAKKPHVNLYIRVDLEDCDDPEISQQTTAFSAAAENFLGIKIDQFASLAETKPEKLGALLQSKIGQTVAVKLNIKAKGELGLLDWIIISMAQEKSDGGDAAGDDGEEVSIVEDRSGKRAKKN